MNAGSHPGTLTLLLAAGLVAVGGALQLMAQTSAPERLVYPVTAITNVVDDYHGVKVADPYRWLEDDNAPATKAWVAAENKVTFGFLESIPERARIRERITKLLNFERYDVPFKQGGRYFLSKNDGLQNHSVLYVAESLTATPRVLLDPNQLSADGTVALADYAISDDGNLMAYGLSSSGSDWQEWKVRDVRTGQDLSDRLQWVKFSGAAWTKDGRGFFYGRYDAPQPGEQLKGVNYFQKLYYHRVGTDQSADALIYERRDHKEWGFGGTVTDDGRYLVVNVWRGTDPKNLIFYQDLRAQGAKFVELIPEFEADFTFIDNDGPVLWFRTDLDAPRGRVVAIDTAHPQREHWREIVPQAEATLQRANIVGGKLIADYLKDARSEVKVFDLDGRLAGAVDLPGLGNAFGFGGKRTDTETFYYFNSYTIPGTIYRYDVATGRSSVFSAPKVDFDSAGYETKQVFFTSKDGARVPMFVTHRRGLKLDGTNPTVLYGYGGFNISQTPGFSVGVAAWLEMGGVYAVPNLRGGGEYGESWHQAGMKLKKQNVFDDFIAAAQWLIANHYTRPAKLAISGGSNGGLLVGACMTQRPELYRAALASVGVMDMLRFQKFTIGWAWTSEYGSSDDPEDFKALYAYSPYHHIKPGVNYPATLITTGDHDDRVVPAHSFKFAARLQACQPKDGPPVLIRIETKAGHGGGKPTTKLLDEAADKWAFVVKELGVQVPPR